MTTRRGEAAFTLIEILVTILILGIILTLLYSVLVSTLESKQKIERISKREKIRAGIIRLIGKDLHAVYTYSTDVGSADGSDGSDGLSPGAEEEEEEEEPPEEEPPAADPKGEEEDTGSEAETIELPRIEGAFLGEDKGDGDSISFLTSWDVPGTEDAPPSDFSRITYAVQPSDQGRFLTLFRGVAPYPEPESGGGKPVFAEIYDRIVQFDIQYLWEDRWVDSWAQDRPPEAIRLTLGFLTEDDDPEEDPPPSSAVSFTIPTS